MADLPNSTSIVAPRVGALWEAEGQRYAVFEPCWEIHRDESLLLVNKPAGLLCHPGADARRPDLMTLLRAHYGTAFPEIVLQHRLDRETSGLVVLTVSAEARVAVYRQFEQREVDKTYLAWVHDPKRRLAARFSCDRSLLVDRGGRVTVSTTGQVASTRFEVLRRSGAFALLQAHPASGRKHQIRVHLLSLGHPIVGDILYKGPPGKRLMLHASRIGLQNGGRTVSFEAPISADFRP